MMLQQYHVYRRLVDFPIIQAVRARGARYISYRSLTDNDKPLTVGPDAVGVVLCRFFRCCL